MRLVENYTPCSNYQLITVEKIPIKLYMVLQPDVDEATREALKSHLLNIPFSFAGCRNVTIHIPKQGYTLSYNINEYGSDNLEYIIDDIRYHPKPASEWTIATL
jgi:hypothetical protein